MSRGLLDWADRAHRVVSRAYPREFRERFGEEMREARRDQVRSQVRRLGPVLAVGAVIWGLAEAMLSGCAERLGGQGFVAQERKRRASMEGQVARVALAFRHSVRRLLRTPMFTAITILSVGFGAGAFASILSVVDGVLLETPSYRDPDRLVWVWRDYTWFQLHRGWLGGPDIAWLREQGEVFESVVAFDDLRTNVTDQDGTQPESVRALLASEEFFETLGVRPLLGRGFARGESDSASAGVVVLGYELWQRRYGADAGIIGREIRAFGGPQRVIGVMPRGFRFAMHASLSDPQTADLYANLQGDLSRVNPNSGRFAGLARVRAGAEPRVQSALDAVASRLDREVFQNRGIKLWSVGLREDLTRVVRPALTALAGAALFLLLALAANLATLLVARAADRTRDAAVRTALGASRVSSVLDLVGESLLVCMAGGALGLLLAPRALDVLLALAPPSLPRLEAIGVDSSVVLVTLLACVLLGVAVALAPAWRLARQPVWSGLRSTGPRAGGSAQASRTRATLVVVQVALTLVLLMGAGLMARSVSALLRVDPGFNAGGVLTLRAPLDGTLYPEPAQVTAFHAEYRNRLLSLPGVRSAGASNAIPLGSATNQTTVSFPGAPGNSGDTERDRPLIDWFVVTPGYFDAMGIALVEGRAIDERDVADAAPTAVIDETLARRFFPGATAVGAMMNFNGDSVRVVGVSRHARFYNVFSDDRGQVYASAAQIPFNGMYHVLRTDREPLSAVPAARAALTLLDASVPAADVRTMESVVRTSLGQQRLSLLLLGGFALGALVLATLGIYGVVANSVVRRTREFGVRLALGAEQRGVLRMVMLDGLRMIVAGLAVGLAGAMMITRVLEGMLFGVNALDPATFAAVTIVLGGVAIAACLVPGWRASRIPPVEALRTD